MQSPPTVGKAAINVETPKALREASGLSLRKLARKMHITAPYLWDLESNNRAWTPAMQARWSVAMGRPFPVSETTTAAANTRTKSI